MKKLSYLFAAMLLALAANANVININTGTSDALRKALGSAVSGDVIVMAAGTYVESNSDYIAFTGKSVTVMAEEGAEVILQPKVPIRLKEGARAEFIGIKFDCGHLSDLGSYSEIIVPADGTSGKGVFLNGCEFYGWQQKSNSIIHTRSDRQLDSVVINNCYFHDNKYTCVLLKYASVACVSITNCTFAGITTDSNAPSAAPIQVDATSGTVVIDQCTFYNCQTKNSDYGAIKIANSIAPVVSNSIFAMPEEYSNGRAIYIADGDVKNCLTYNYAKDENTGIHSGPAITACITGDPLFRNAAGGDYTLSAGSPAFGAGVDGADLGDPRWIPKMEYYLVGSMTDWTVDPRYKLSVNPENEAEYMIALTLYHADQFKIVQSDGASVATWYPDGMGNDYTVARSGDYIVYFRPDGKGGEGWHNGYIYAAASDLGPWSAWFGDGNGQEEFDSYVTYDAQKQVAEVYILQDKVGQWQAQIKYQGLKAEDGKCYHVALKMMANRDVNGVSLKWQDDNNTPNVIYENQSINLAESEEYVYDAVVAGVAGEQGSNGILVLDFGWAKAGSIIKIYDVVIEETECPEPPTYYLAGSMTEWAALDEYKFAESATVADEYTVEAKLEAGMVLKVVGISEGEETWYPAGFAAGYEVDAAHAGEKTVYFRPAGNDEWQAFGGYIYIDATSGVQSTSTVINSAKFVRNGHVIIRHNGKTYNVLGEAVE